MRTRRVLVVMLGVTLLGGRLEAATGGGAVRAAVRLRTVIAAEPVLGAALGDEAADLVSDLRVARHGVRLTRHTAYVAAAERARLLDAALMATTNPPARTRLLGAVHALEAALARAASCGCPAIATRAVCGRDGKTYVGRCARRCAGVDEGHQGPCP